MLSTPASLSPSQTSLKKYNFYNSFSLPESMGSEISDQETEAAVLALTNLSEKPHRKSQSTVSDIVDNIQPKVVHAPAKNPLMVDHTYSDYSGITEDFLFFLELDEDVDKVLKKLTEEEKAEQERKLNRLRLVFGDVAPARKSSGGVVKPFPERVGDSFCFLFLQM